ncbi:AmpG permease [Cronobacter universalis NCTC 9529]|nr:AmpG permease [Cronobacter universalis NCTC 9529]
MTFGVTLLEAGLLLAFAGIVLGCLLDYLALRNGNARSEP